MRNTGHCDYFYFLTSGSQSWICVSEPLGVSLKWRFWFWRSGWDLHFPQPPWRHLHLWCITYLTGRVLRSWIQVAFCIILPSTHGWLPPPRRYFTSFTVWLVLHLFDSLGIFRCHPRKTLWVSPSFVSLVIKLKESPRIQITLTTLKGANDRFEINVPKYFIRKKKKRN